MSTSAYATGKELPAAEVAQDDTAMSSKELPYFI